jgi:hypothetical protein
MWLEWSAAPTSIIQHKYGFDLGGNFVFQLLSQHPPPITRAHTQAYLVCLMLLSGMHMQHLEFARCSKVLPPGGGTRRVGFEEPSCIPCNLFDFCLCSGPILAHCPYSYPISMGPLAFPWFHVNFKAPFEGQWEHFADSATLAPSRIAEHSRT